MTTRDPKRREKLLSLADGLWLSRGYAGFSFGDLSTGSGLKKPSVYHHFPSKEALLLALIAHHAKRSADFYAAMDSCPAPQALGAFFKVYEGLLEHPGRLCPAGAICADLEVLPRPAAELGRRYLQGQEAWLSATLARGPWSLSAPDHATMILGALQGSLQRARAEGSPEPLRGTLRVLQGQLGI